MNIQYTLGILIGVLCGLILAVILLKATKRDGKIKCRYDERQELARGRAFKYGFFTLLIGDAVYALLDEVGLGLPLTGGGAAAIIIVIGVAVMVSYSIWQDAYFSLNENRKRLMVVFGALGLCNLVIGIRHILDGTIQRDGILDFRIMNLLCGGLFLLVFVELAVKQIVDSRAD